MGAWKLLLQSSSTSIKYEVIRRTMTSFYGVLSRAMGSPTPYWTGFGRICQVEGNSFAAKVHDCRPFCWHAEFHRVRCSGQSRLSSSCTSPTRLHWVRSTVCLHINSLFDTQIYDSCLPSHIDEFSSKVSGYVNDVADWMRSNRLQINPEKYDTIRYDTIEINVDSKAEYSALSCTGSQKKKLKQTTPVPLQYSTG